MADDCRDDLPPYPEVHLCVHCLAENLPTFNFCHDCGVPLHFCASTSPFQNLWAEGWIYRNAVERPGAMQIAGLHVLFLPQLLFGSWWLLNYDWKLSYFSDPEYLTQLAFALGSTLFSLAILFRAAASFGSEEEDEVSD